MGWITVLAVVCAVGRSVLGLFLIGIGSGFAALIWSLVRYGELTWTRATFWVCAGYPWLVLALLYLTWLVAWGTLGHPPIPSRNDPFQISNFVSILGQATYILVLGWPVPLLGAGGMAFLEAFDLIARLQPGPTRSTGITFLILAPIFLWLGAVILYGLDPVHAMNWLAD